jgi:hypothetical protein
MLPPFDTPPDGDFAHDLVFALLRRRLQCGNLHDNKP